MSLAWLTLDCPLDTCRGMCAGFSQSSVCVCVSLSLVRRGGKKLDVPDGGKQQVEEL